MPTKSFFVCFHSVCFSVASLTEPHVICTIVHHKKIMQKYVSCAQNTSGCSCIIKEINLSVVFFAQGLFDHIVEWSFFAVVHVTTVYIYDLFWEVAHHALYPLYATFWVNKRALYRKNTCTRKLEISPWCIANFLHLASLFIKN